MAAVLENEEWCVKFCWLYIAVILDYKLERAANFEGDAYTGSVAVLFDLANVVVYNVTIVTVTNSTGVKIVDVVGF